MPLQNTRQTHYLASARVLRYMDRLVPRYALSALTPLRTLQYVQRNMYASYRENMCVKKQPLEGPLKYCILMYSLDAVLLRLDTLSYFNNTYSR